MAGLVETLDNQRENDKADVNAGLPKRIGLKAFVGTFGTNMFTLMCALIQGVVLARLLGVEGRGEYAAIILWPNVFANIGLVGTNIAIGRIAARCGDVGSVFRASLILTMLLSLVTVFAGFFLLPYLIPVEQHYLLPFANIFLIFVPFYQLTASLAAIEQGTGEFFRLNIVRIFRSPFYILCLLVVFFAAKHELIWFLVAGLVTFGAVALVRLAMMLKRYSVFGSLYSPTSILGTAKSFGIVEIAQQGYQYIDKVLLLWLLQPKQMGFYVIAMSSATLIRGISSSMGVVSFTITAQESDAEGFQRVASIFRKAVVAMFIVGVPLALFMPLLLPLVYGDDFRGAVLPAILLIPGSAFAGLALLLDQCMRGQGKPYAGLTGRIGAMLVLVLVGYPASRMWGTEGIAVAFLVAQFIYMTTLAIRLRTHYNKARLLSFVPGRADFREVFSIAIASARRVKRKISLG